MLSKSFMLFTSTDINTSKSCPLIWPRAIILIDMNAFFASIEQLDHPEWRGRPVAVTNGLQGTCIITCSYEARAYGIKTGMRLKDAKKLCPDLIQCAARPERYTEVSTAIMKGLEVITPEIEIFSVDEAFLDVTHCQQLHGTPARMAKMAQRLVNQISGVSCSIGVSGDKTTAKYAAKQQKPHGFTIIPPWESEKRLQPVPVTDLCGIAGGIGRFLANYGVYTCGDMKKLPISILAQRFGNIGRRIWYMCQGLDPDPVQTKIADPKSMGHGKVMPPNTQDKEIILTYLQHLTEKLAERLRRHHMMAQHFFVGLLSYDFGWFGGKTHLAALSQDGQEIFALAKNFILKKWHGQGVCQIQITALDPQPEFQQSDLFVNYNRKIQKRNAAIDAINERYGEFMIAPARLLKRSAMPNVIAPAWKPYGHRQTIIPAVKHVSKRSISS